MESSLYYLTLALGISVIINLLLKRLGISQIIGYIFTGVAVSYAFDLHALIDKHTLEEIAEFGIVFLMFTIGLEISLERLGSMKKIVFFNGFLQVALSSALFYALIHFLFALDVATSIIISMALSLSSTAVVLTYLKSTKEIHRPYGQNAMGILIFQDLAVIPILLLIGFLGSRSENIVEVLQQTFISALLILLLLFIIGKKLMTWLLHFSSRSNVEELFMGSVLVIVIASSLLAHEFGFSYSLGAFIAGMIIAETKYHHKVESDIAPFKDLLLGTFFITVGMKIDLGYLAGHFEEILALLVGVMVLKAVILFGIIRIGSHTKTSFKTAFALAQVGEFSFAIFALAANSDLLDPQTAQILVLTVVMSLLITPFMLQFLPKMTELFFPEAGQAEHFELIAEHRNHIVICGYSIVGKFIAKEMREKGFEHIIIDNNYKHIKEAQMENEEVYFADMSKISVLEKLHLENAAGVVITLDNLEKKRLICEALQERYPNLKIVVKITSLEEKESLENLNIEHIIDAKKEVAHILTEQVLHCGLPSIKA